MDNRMTFQKTEERSFCAVKSNLKIPFIILLLLLPLTAGCSQKMFAAPITIPQVEGLEEVSFADSSALFTCSESDRTNHLLFSSMRVGQVFYNKRNWCDKFVVSLTNETKKRGLANGSEKNKVDVTFPNMEGYLTYATIGFRPKVILSSPSGWSKKYTTDMSASFYGDMTPRRTTIRSSEETVRSLVKVVLSDKEFQDEMKKLKP